MKTTLLTLTLIGLMAGSVLQGAGGARTAKPNIILIFTDDHGFADLGCQGVAKDVRTPNIDALAASGVRMAAGYVSAPQCAPSRGGLLSGQFQNRFGLESNANYNDPGVQRRFDELKTIAERLKSAGYATGMAGKWHLGPDDSALIAKNGFDRVFFKHSDAPGSWNMDLTGRDIAPQVQRGGAYHLELVTTFACSFIERFKEQPFFFYLAYRAPHVPLDATQKYLDRFPGPMPERRRKALAAISAVDDGVGRIMETLRKNGLEENTLIFVISDNGAPLKMLKLDAPGGGPGWNGSLNDPLNGEKGMLTEGGIRTPFVVHWKGTIPGGQVYPNPVISLDVAATANALAGLPDDPALDGVNLMPYLTGRKTGAPHDALYWWWSGQLAIRRGEWKYLMIGDRHYLFNIAADPGEQHNLLVQHPELGQALRLQLEHWSRTLIPPGVEIPQTGRVNLPLFDFFMDGKVPPLRNPVDGETGRKKKAKAPARDDEVE